MAVKIQKKTESSQLLKLISVTDDAIDWSKSYADEDASDDDKKLRYAKEHDLQALVFADGAAPTLFVFEHPHRVDVGRKIRGLYTKSLTGQGVGVDLWTEIWDKAYLGTEEGLDGAPRDQPPRRDGRMTDAYFQALEDSGIFAELALAFLAVVGRDRSSPEKK